MSQFPGAETLLLINMFEISPFLFFFLKHSLALVVFIDSDQTGKNKKTCSKASQQVSEGGQKSLYIDRLLNQASNLAAQYYAVVNKHWSLSLFFHLAALFVVLMLAFSFSL